MAAPEAQGGKTLRMEPDGSFEVSGLTDATTTDRLLLRLTGADFTVTRQLTIVR